jgi:hypothetical protein
MNNPQDDKIAGLYQKIPKASPSEMLDARIRQQARRQLKTGRHHSLRWLSVAALIVLSVGVVLRIIDEVPVQPSLEDSLDIMEMDAAAIIKEEAATADDKMKKAAKPVMDAAPAARMKLQQMPAVAEPAAIAPMAPIAPAATISGASQAESVMESRSDSLTFTDNLFLPENYCGMEKLRGAVDKQVLEAIIKKLLNENRLQQAECVKKLMNQNFQNN